MSMEVGVQEHERTGQRVDSICSTKSREISRQLPAQTPSCLHPSPVCLIPDHPSAKSLL